MFLQQWSKSKTIPVKYYENKADNENKDPSPHPDTIIYPKVEIKEEKEKYFLKVEMHGVLTSDIDIDFYNNILTIKGKRRCEADAGEFGSFSSEETCEYLRRDIPFAEDIDEVQITAKLITGTLHIELVKNQK